MHPNSPSEASKLREVEASYTANMLAAAGVGFGTENWDEVEELSIWMERGASTEIEGRANLL
jgi:hypothetical protein